MSEHEIAMAVAFANEAETWLMVVKPYMPERELKIALDDAIRANKRVRNLIVGRENLDNLTDCSAIFSEIGLMIRKDPTSSAELMALLKAWTDGDVRKEDTEQQNELIESLRTQNENLQTQLKYWQDRADTNNEIEPTYEFMSQQVSDFDLITIGKAAEANVYKQLNTALNSRYIYRDTGELLDEDWSIFYMGIPSQELAKKAKAKRLNAAQLQKAYSFFYESNEVELEEERSAVA